MPSKKPRAADQSGGVNVTSGSQTEISGDVVGRDKITHTHTNNYFSVLGGNRGEPPHADGQGTGHTPSKRGGRIYWILTLLVVLILVALGGIVALTGKIGRQPYTVYFLVDATEKMGPGFDSVRKQVQIAASAVRDDSRIGLRVYGGDENSGVDCQDSRQLVEPSTYSQAQKVLDSKLAGITPSGHSSMMGAALATLGDVQKENRPVRVVLITSGIDPLCDPVAGDVLKAGAKDLGKNVELIIISIGVQDANNQRLFNSYADAFHGAYIALDTPEKLPNLVKSISIYGYGYEY